MTLVTKTLGAVLALSVTVTGAQALEQIGRASCRERVCHRV